MPCPLPLGYQAASSQARLVVLGPTPLVPGPCSGGLQQRYVLSPEPWILGPVLVVSSRVRHRALFLWFLVEVVSRAPVLMVSRRGRYRAPGGFQLR